MTTDLVYHAIGRLVPGGISRGETRRGSRTLRWIEAGSGEPAVILGSGAGEPGSLAWAAVMAALAEETRVIAYDRAGLGDSDPAPELSLGQALDDLVAVVRAVSDRPSVLVGHSWGGLLALLTACQHPEIAGALVLVDPADERYWQALPENLLHADEETGQGFLAEWEQGRMAQIIRDMAWPEVRRLTGDPGLREQLVEAYASCYQTADQVGVFLAETRVSLSAIPEINSLRSTFPVPDIPVIVLSATVGHSPEYRAVWTRAHADIVRRARAGTHVVVDGAGHAVHQERPAEVVGAIRSVIERSGAAEGR